MPVYGKRPDDVVIDAAGNAQTGATITLHATEADAQAGANVIATATTSAGRWTATVSQSPVWVRTPNGSAYLIEDFSAKADKSYVDTALGAKLDTTTANSTYALGGNPARRGSLVPVATRTHLNNMRQLSNGTDTSATSRVTHEITADCSGLRIYYANISSNANATSPTDGPSTVTYKCDVEGADGKRQRGWTTTGSRSMALEPGGIGYFEVTGTFKAGDRIYTRTYVSVPASGKWPRNMTTNTGTQTSMGEGVTTGSDLTLPSTTAVTQTFTWVAGPVMILGNQVTPKPTVAFIGDSIAAGQADDADRGFLVLACAAQGFGYVNLAQQGETAAMYLTANEGGTRAFGLDHVTHAICEYGVNDIYNNSNSLATWQANQLTIWKAVARRGVKVWQTTITPKSASTDSWTTTGNQTPDAATATRNAANDWLRAGAPINGAGAAVAVGTAGALLAGQPGHPLSGYFEVADAVETARNSGLWKVTGAANYATADGTHPSKTGHALMAAALDLSAFSL